MFYKTEILEALMPALTQTKTLVSLNLACNKLGDEHCHLISKII